MKYYILNLYSRQAANTLINVKTSYMSFVYTDAVK